MLLTKNNKHGVRQIGIFDAAPIPAQFSETCTCQSVWTDAFIRKINTLQLGEIFYCQCGNATLPFGGKILLTHERAVFIKHKELDDRTVRKLWFEYDE